ncbi:hypothetical protein Pstu01_36770 [Stutzerimonas stutzeri]|jgi:hypothetical protein|nr:hypothetical protein Pstu01_36770 [Stutzerimonas stutzeri]
MPIRDAINAHNASIRVVIGSGGKRKKAKTLDIINRELRECVKAMQEGRNHALSKLAVFEADAEFYRRKCKDISRVIKRLRGGLAGLSSV